MKAITVHQPWASLISCGVKRIETRSWSTDYRGPLAIHAAVAAKKADHRDPVWQHCTVEGGSALLKPELRPLVFGAVVATCTLTDVLPISDGMDGRPAPRPRIDVYRLSGLAFTRPVDDSSDVDVDLSCEDLSDQLPYGDFTPGRYAWLLEDVVPLAEPVPARGRQRLWGWTP